MTLSYEKAESWWIQFYFMYNYFTWEVFDLILIPCNFILNVFAQVMQSSSIHLSCRIVIKIVLRVMVEQGILSEIGEYPLIGKRAYFSEIDVVIGISSNHTNSFWLFSLTKKTTEESLNDTRHFWKYYPLYSTLFNIKYASRSCIEIVVENSCLY